MVGEDEIDPEYIDAVEDQLDEAEEIQEGQADTYGVGTYPEQKAQENIYNWFWKVVNLGKPERVVKVGNLNATEIGTTSISVRDAINLSNLGHIFHHKTFGNYFATLAMVTSATSMAKSGWFMELSISQKKVRERSRKPTTTTSENQPWKIFSRKKKAQQPQEE